MLFFSLYQHQRRKSCWAQYCCRRTRFHHVEQMTRSTASSASRQSTPTCARITSQRTRRLWWSSGWTPSAWPPSCRRATSMACFCSYYCYNPSLFKPGPLVTVTLYSIVKSALLVLCIRLNKEWKTFLINKLVLQTHWNNYLCTLSKCYFYYSLKIAGSKKYLVPL